MPKQKILLIFLGLILILGILELFLRLHPAFGYNYQSFKFKSEKLAIGDFSYMRPSVLLGYEHIPNINHNLIRINSYGLIGREYGLKKNKNIFRILLLGDSIAEQGYPGEFLEAELNSKIKLQSEYTFEVWNAGVASYDVRRYALYLKHKGLNYNPDMVIIFLFMNDFDLNTNVYYKTDNGAVEYHFPISEISKAYIPDPFLMRHSYLYRFIILRMDSFLMSKRKMQGINSKEENGKYYLRTLKQICQKKDISLFIVIFPYLKPLDTYADWQMDQYLVISKVVKDSRIPNLDLYNLYEQLGKENFPLRERDKDDIHPSKEAHRLIAREIYNRILDNFLNKAQML